MERINFLVYVNITWQGQSLIQYTCRLTVLGQCKKKDKKEKIKNVTNLKCDILKNVIH
jgi:hypothetical protein